MQPKPHLFSPEGQAALDALLRQGPLLAFDFDGTLAPIVARPQDARISQAVAKRLHLLGQRLPVAIVTGRAVDDVRGRLGFEPQFIVGNHGAEDVQDAAAAQALARALDPLRQRLAAHRPELAAAGVFVEDKGQSIALHYRLSRRREEAVALIRELLLPVDPALHVFSGKMVENVVAAGAPDKASAMHALVARCAAGSAFFAGDDVNDEPVFASAPAHWLTVRIGRDHTATMARFCLDSPVEVALLLQRLLEGLETLDAA